MKRAPASVVFAVSCLMTAAVVAQTPAPLDRIELPAVVSFPEGVAYDASRNAIFTAGAVNGALLRLDLRSGASTVVSPGGTLVPQGTTAFPAMLGMKVDGQNRLWVSGGATGRMFVLDAVSGKLLKQLEVPNPSGSIINDVAVVGNAGYFTDTRFPTLWRVEAKGTEIGALEPWLSFEKTPLTYATGRNLNGIAATTDGRSLIVVHMDRGALFKIDIATKAVSPIDLAGADLSTADGLVLDGSTLYVVRQGAGEVVTVQLAPNLASGKVTARFKHPALAFPATAAKVGNELLVVNTQFNTRTSQTQVTPFSIVRIPLSRLASGN